MTRYYYIDPLAAAWMAKHFGIKLQICIGGVSQPTSDDFNYLTLAEGDMKRFGVTYCIHPDSLHLLEPQAGDALKVIGGHYHEEVCNYPIPERYKARWTGKPELQPTEYQGCQSIQRNGIAFMWPERE